MTAHGLHAVRRALEDFVDQDGQVKATPREVAGWAGYSERWTRRMLRELEQAGTITRPAPNVFVVQEVQR